jgi:hypothetical protein
MAKTILADADAIMLPRWTSGDVEIEPARLSIFASRVEVPLLGGAVRADAVIQGVHAVDSLKRETLRENGIDAIEIDLSELDEDAVSDQMAFRHFVLEDSRNRHWVNLATGQYVAERAERTLIEVEDVLVTERVITTKAGSPFTIREQWAYLVKPGSRAPVRLQIPDDTVGEEAVPYPRGLHSVSTRSITVGQWGHIRLRHKVYLDQIEMSPPDAHDMQIGLFEGPNIVDGPGFRVRQRDWKGRPGL